jgi:hypothetical protein
MAVIGFRTTLGQLAAGFNASLGGSPHLKTSQKPAPHLPLENQKRST